MSRGQPGSAAPEGREGRGARQGAAQNSTSVASSDEVAVRLEVIRLAARLATHGVAVGPSPHIIRSRPSTTSNKPLKLTGKVTEMRWSNPHAWIYIDVDRQGRQGRELGVGNRRRQRAVPARMAEGRSRRRHRAGRSTAIRRATDRRPPTRRASPSRMAAGSSPDPRIPTPPTNNAVMRARHRTSSPAPSAFGTSRLSSLA